MKAKGRDLETIISYILTIGVLASLIVEAVGLGYYATNESLEVDFTSRWQTSGNDFFAYALGTLLSFGRGATPLSLIALGIVLLMSLLTSEFSRRCSTSLLRETRSMP